MANAQFRQKSILCMPRDLSGRNHVYQPLRKDHPAAKDALEIMSRIADHIEQRIGPNEPYEINLIELKSILPTSIEPTLTIGIVHSERIEKLLHQLDIPFKVHLFSHYPTPFSSVKNPNPLPDRKFGVQQDIPSVGSSCGLLAKRKFSITIGAYVRLDSEPKKIYVLTAPLNVKPSVLVPKDRIVTQPSVADRNFLNDCHDRFWAAHDSMLKPDQRKAKAEAKTAHRQQLQETFGFARTLINSTSELQPASSTDLGTAEAPLSGTILDGSHSQERGSNRLLARASDRWAILEVTRETTVAAFSQNDKGRNTIHPLIPGLLVSKTGRTTGRTFGTVNGVRSLYRLPQDGKGVRRYDYPVLSFPHREAFGSPGDAGAVVLTQQSGDQDLEDNKMEHPCAMIVASSTSGLVSFVQDMESIAAGIKRAGLGDMTFVEPSG